MMRALVPSLRWTAALLAVVVLTSCDSSLQEPGEGGPASVAVAASVATSHAGDAGLVAAFEAADSLEVRLTRHDDGSTLAERSLAFDASGGDVTEATLELDLEEDRVDALLELSLLAGADRLFMGGSALTLEAGGEATVEVGLVPVARTLELRDEPLAFTALDDSVALHATMLFATGDTIGGVQPDWSSDDPSVAEVLADGTVVSRGAGQTLVRAAHTGATDSVAASVQLQFDTRAYVTNQSSGDVSVIDVATNSATDTIPVGSGPWGVAVTPDGATAYVSNNGSADVSVIDVATNSVTTTIPVGSGPRDVAVTPDGATAYVSNYDANTVSAIDVASNTVTATIQVSGGPDGLAVTPDGATAYVSNNTADNVSVIDVATSSVTTTIPVGSRPLGNAVAPDGSTVYVTNATTNTVSVIDVATNTVTDTIPVGDTPEGVTVTPDGSTAYVGNVNADNVSVVDLASNTVTTTLSGVAGFPYRLRVTPDGSSVYVADAQSTVVPVIDVATNTVTDSIQVGDGPRDVAFTP